MLINFLILLQDNAFFLNENNQVEVKITSERDKNDLEKYYKIIAVFKIYRFSYRQPVDVYLSY